MRFSGWVCSLVFLSLGVSAHAQGATECISQTEMTEIARSFPQFRSLANAEYCMNESETSHLLAGIMFMRKTQFAPSMPKSNDEMFSGRFASNWWDYFIGRINEFEVQGSCAKGIVAYVYFFGNTMYVCPAALTANMTALDLASVFMHEARHIDGFPHVTCRQGPRAGLQGACDDMISEGGSYAVTVETYAQLAKYATDLHPALRAYSRSASAIYANEAFDTPVRVDLQTNFLLMTNDTELHQLNLDNGIATTAVGHAPSLGQINMRAQHMVLYPDDKTLPSKFMFARDEGDIPQAAGDISMEYNSQSPTQRSEWRGVHISAQWTTKVLRSKLVFTCDPRAATVREVSTAGEIPLAIVYPNGYDRAARSANIIMESGKVFEFGCTSNSPVFRDAGFQYDHAFKRIHKVGANVIALGVDGILYRLQGTTSTKLSTSLDGRIHDLVPMYTLGFF